MSFGDFMIVGGFIKKIAPETTITHSKQANRWQLVIQPMKTMKDNSSRLQKTPCRSLGQMATLRSSFTLRRLVCISKIYTFNLRRFIFGASNGDQGNWRGLMTWWFLAPYSTSIPCPLLVNILPPIACHGGTRDSCSGFGGCRTQWWTQ
jgi:hypothetical protein